LAPISTDIPALFADRIKHGMELTASLDATMEEYGMEHHLNANAQSDYPGTDFPALVVQLDRFGILC
jgi:hypothetical protein